MGSVINFCSKFESGEFGLFDTKENVNARALALAKEVYGKVFTLSKEQSLILDVTVDQF